MGSTFIERWSGDGYPDFVGEGTGDQHTINAAICALKKGSYDGVDCVDMDDSATGTVRPLGLVLRGGGKYVFMSTFCLHVGHVVIVRDSSLSSCNTLLDVLSPAL